MRKLIFIILLVVASPIIAKTWQDNKQLTKLFTDQQRVATFVVYDVEQQQLVGYNQIRANQRFIPASTFKIVNSLIGLASETVKNVDEKLSYGGKPQPRKEWQQDMGLREAIKVSNVPIYQELARRIGLTTMQANIKLLNYGNTNIGRSVDSFWLEGPLKISAVEQALFLADLAQKQLPYAQHIQEAVHGITLLEQGKNWQLHGKTGLTGRNQGSIGWFVGWVEKEGRIYSFALNMQLAGTNQDISIRVTMAKQALQLLGIL